MKEFILLCKGEEYGWYILSEHDTLDELKKAYTKELSWQSPEKLQPAHRMKIVYNLSFDDGMDDSIIGSLP